MIRVLQNAIIAESLESYCDYSVQELQEISFKYRLQAIDQENEAIDNAQASNKNFETILLTNDDTAKKLQPVGFVSNTKTNQSGPKNKQNAPQYYLNYNLTYKKPMIQISI